MPSTQPDFSYHFTDQAESSPTSVIAPSLQVRILIELQVISNLLAQNIDSVDDLSNMRRDIAQSLT